MYTGEKGSMSFCQPRNFCNTRAPGAPLLTVIKTLFRDNLQVVLDGYILFKITKPFNLNS